MSEKLHSLFLILGTVLLALSVLTSIRHSSFNTKLKSEQIARVLELIASVLLPIVVLNIVRRADISSSLWSSFAIGFMLPVFAYAIVFAIAKLPFVANVFSVDGSANHLLLSSFGGGNRGTLVILTAFGAQTSFNSDVIMHFVVLDIGNLICLLSLGFMLAGRLSAIRQQLKPSDILGKLLKNPGTYAVTLILLQLPMFMDSSLSKAIASLNPLLEVTGVFLNALFSFCIFLAIFIRIDSVSEMLINTKDVLTAFLLSRILTIIGVVVLLTTLNFSSALIIAAVILALMPPSSFLWIAISQMSSPLSSSKKKAVYLVPNFFYFAILAGAFLWGLME